MTTIKSPSARMLRRGSVSGAALDDTANMAAHVLVFTIALGWGNYAAVQGGHRFAETGPIVFTEATATFGSGSDRTQPKRFVLREVDGIWTWVEVI